MDQVQTVPVDSTTMSGFVCGRGPAMAALNTMVGELACSDIPVLILGESGTGKDAYARLIHHLSPQGNSQLIKINCSSFEPSELVTQVDRVKHAISDIGSTHSIYLDNIQELDLAAQRVVLAQLPDSDAAGSIEAAKVRFISSSTRNLESEVAAGRFRRELYFRLNGACLRLPPLKERSEDIPALIEFFLNKYASMMKEKTPVLSSKVIQTLTSYHWPGNIRELENLLRKIVVLGDVHMVMNEFRSSSIMTDGATASVSGGSLKVAARAASKQAERELILQALERTRWNRKRAARELQISYKSLLYKIKQLEAFPGAQENGGRKN